MSTSMSISRDKARSESDSVAIYDAFLLKRLWLYLRPYSLLVGTSVAFLVIHSALGVAGPLLTQVAVDLYLQPTQTDVSFLEPYLPADPSEGILRIALIYLVVIAFMALTRGIQIFCMNLTGQRVMRNIRREIFEHLQRLPVSWFDRNRSGRVVTRVTTDVDVLNELFTSGFVAVAGDLLTLFCAFGAMLYLSPKLTLVYVTIAPVVLFVSVQFRKYARDYFREVRASFARLAAYLQESFTGILEIQLNNHEKRAVQEFKAINEDHRRANYGAVQAHAIFFPVIELVNVFGMTLLIVVGGGWVIDGTLTIGVLLAFLQYGTRVFRPIQDLAEKYNLLQSAMAGAERIFLLLDEQVPKESSETKVHVGTKSKSIEFRNVWFAYKDEDWVLKNVSFKVTARQMMAIVGHTGAGKSTIVSLLLRYYEPQKGVILVGGKSVKRWFVSDLRRQFGVVLQDPNLFSGSIADNIGMNDEEFDDQSIQDAAENAQLGKYIESLPEGYGQQILERGAMLSTGHKQLLAFARALLRNRPILILDEATSSVDPGTEQDIRVAVSRLLQKRTSIVIAHRLSTIRQADRILVLHKGEIVETGTHYTLMKTDSIYSHLYRMQHLADDLEHTSVTA